MVGNFVSLNYACEESFVDYLISQCDPLQTTASYYTGTGDVAEMQAPAVFVNCEMGSETFPFSNVYDMTVNISVKEMAADISGSINNTGYANGLGMLAANIYNAVCNPNIKAAINTGNTRNFSTLFIQKMDNRHSVSGDALISDMMVRCIGCLSGSL